MGRPLHSGDRQPVSLVGPAARHTGCGRGPLLPARCRRWRETIVTSVIDAQPHQVLRLPGPTFITLFAALFTGGFFIFGTFHWWGLAGISAVLALGTILYWLWTGTAFIPEKEAKSPASA